MEELLDLLKPSLLEIAGVLLSVFIGWLGVQIKAIYKDWFDTKQKRAIFYATVKYVEQVGKSLGSDEKFALAKKTALAWLNDKGFKVSEAELNVLIESAVNDLFPKFEEDSSDSEDENSIGGLGKSTALVE